MAFPSDCLPLLQLFTVRAAIYANAIAFWFGSLYALVEWAVQVGACFYATPTYCHTFSLPMSLNEAVTLFLDTACVP